MQASPMCHRFLRGGISHSSLDPVFPTDVHEQAVSRLTAQDGVMITDTNERTHIQAFFDVGPRIHCHTLGVPVFENRRD